MVAPSARLKKWAVKNSPFCFNFQLSIKTAFGVDFVLLELDLGKKHNKDEVREYYLKLYRSFLPEKMFKEHIKAN